MHVHSTRHTNMTFQYKKYEGESVNVQIERKNYQKYIRNEKDTKEKEELVRDWPSKNISLPLKSLPMMIFDTNPTAPITP